MELEQINVKRHQVEKWLAGVEELFAVSPIRKALQSGRELPVELGQHLLETTMENVKAYRNNLGEPLRLVLMGEVKSGKSTLMNALAGAEIAPTDVLEATAAIQEVVYGDKARGVIRFRDGSTIEDTIEGIYELLRSHRGDQDFFSNCEMVRTELPLPGLTSINIVDTPGLATLTEANQRKTRDYARESDVVLWVLNANHLGQADVKDEMSRVARIGKPIIAIINRVDEANTSTERLVRYVEQEYAAYIRAVFPLSARQAFESVVKGDEDGKDASGFGHLLRFLREEIQEEKDRAKFGSIISSTCAALRQEQVIHSSFMRQVRFMEERAHRHLEELNLKRDEIDREIEGTLKSKVINDFPGPQLDWVLDRIDQLKLFSGAGQTQEIKSAVEDMLSGEAVMGFLTRILEGAQGDFEKAWRESMQGFKDSILHDLEQFKALESRTIQSELACSSEPGQPSGLARREELAQPAGIARSAELVRSVPDLQSEVIQGAIHGTALASGAGVGLAAYAAALGPAAAYLSFGSALIAFVPPAAIAGLITGAVAKYLSHQDQKRKFRAQIQGAVQQCREALIHQVIEPHIIPELHRQSERVVEQLADTMARNVYRGWTQDEVNSLISEVELYLTKLEQSMGEAPQG